MAGQAHVYFSVDKEVVVNKGEKKKEKTSVRCYRVILDNQSKHCTWQDKLVHTYTPVNFFIPQSLLPNPYETPIKM